MSDLELYHFGVPGMKWGVRRARKAVKKYSGKAQRQIDANMQNAKVLKKMLDSDFDPIDERRLTSEDRKMYTHQYKTAINTAKKWLATRDDILNMKVSEIRADDVKRKYKNTASTSIYYPFA